MQYLPTGDKALLVAWAVVPLTVGEVTQNEINMVLCLEDGQAVAAPLDQVKFDYRYDNATERWFDVSRVADGQPSDEETSLGNADPQAGDDGSPSVPRQVPNPDGAGPGDPLDQPGREGS